MMATLGNEIKNIQNLELKTLSDLHTFISEGPCCKKYSNPFDSAFCLLHMGSDDYMQLHIINIKIYYLH